MERFPTLNIILRFGTAGAVLVAAAVAILIGAFAWPALGWGAVVIAIVVAALVFMLGRSYVELVTLITEMLVPR